MDNHEGPGSPAMRPGEALKTHSITIGGSRFRIMGPADPASLLDDPELEARYAADNYLPYWAELWPSAIMLAGYILTAPMSDLPPTEAKALEVGAGLGLAGIAAARRGYETTITDYEPKAIEYIQMNCEANGVRATVTLLDWRDPTRVRYGLLLGSDVIYENRHHEPIRDWIARSLEPEGVALIADPDRRKSAGFVERLRSDGFRADPVPCEATLENGMHIPGTVWRVRLSPQAIP